MVKSKLSKNEIQMKNADKFSEGLKRVVTTPLDSTSLHLTRLWYKDGWVITDLGHYGYVLCLRLELDLGLFRIRSGLTCTCITATTAVATNTNE